MSDAALALPACPHRPPCPGCPGYGAPLVAGHGYDTLATFVSQRGIPLLTRSGPALGYRHRARLAVRGRSRSPKVGVFQLGTHRPVDIPNCRVHHPVINRVARALRGGLRAHGLEPYREATHAGRVRYLQVSVERASGAAQVVLVDNAAEPAGLDSLWQYLQAELGEQLHSLFWNGQQSRGNVILGPAWQRILGPEALVEELGGAKVFYPPAAFAQANMELFAEVVEAIHGLVPRGARVLELYGGVGAIGLGLAARGERVAINELGAGSLAGLRLGVAELVDAGVAAPQVLAGPAEAHVAAIGSADVIIVDPPRKGLDPAVLAALCAAPRSQVVYLSCGLPTFIRDARELLRSGYALRYVEAIDLFPNTGHVETLAVFAEPALPVPGADEFGTAGPGATDQGTVA